MMQRVTLATKGDFPKELGLQGAKTKKMAAELENQDPNLELEGMQARTGSAGARAGARSSIAWSLLRRTQLQQQQQQQQQLLFDPTEEKPLEVSSALKPGNTSLSMLASRIVCKLGSWYTASPFENIQLLIMALHDFLTEA